MENKIHFQVTTADGAVCDEMVNFVSAPIVDGEVGILSGHAPMIASLKEGVVKYKIDDEEHYAAISGGVLSVADNELIILARSAEKAESIDLARAQAAERRARERIESKSAEWDMKRVELSLSRALAREKAYNFLNKQ